MVIRLLWLSGRAVVAQARGVLGSTAGLSLSTSQHLNSFIYSMRQDVLSNYNIIVGGVL